MAATPGPERPQRRRPVRVAAAVLLRLLRRSRRREKLLATVFDALPQGVVVLAADGGLALTNRAARELLGGQPTPACLVKIATAGGGGEVQVPTPDGAVRHLSVDARGLPCGTVAVLRDVTGRKLADRRLAAHVLALEEQLDLLDLAHDAVLIRDAGNRITYCNRAAEALYGRPRQELIGQPCDALLGTRFPNTREAVEAALAATGVWTGEVQQQRADGTPLVVHSRQAMRLDTAGRPHAIIEINSDITGRRYAEARLRATEEQQRLLLDGARDHAILMLDPDGLVMSWSTSAERLKGYQEEEILGRPYAVFFPPDQVAAGIPERILDDARATGRVDVEGMRIRRDGTSFWANAVITAAYADDGTLRGFVKVTRDETHRRQAAEEITALNAELRDLDKLKSDLIATVSHELRTPLTSIRGYTELLLDGEAGDLGAMQRRMLGVIDHNGARLLTLVEDLLAFARVDAGNFAIAAEPVSMADLIGKVDAVVRPALPSQVRLVRATPPDVPMITGDPEQLERALLCLLNNAVKFSPGGGTVTLCCEYDSDEVRVTVSDTGIGIPADEHGRLFERFFRASTAREQHIQGTGLGLALVKTIIEGHGGQVVLRSAPDAGTTVTVHLPRRPRTLSRSAAP